MPHTKPRVAHNYLTTEEDRRSICDGVRLALEIAAQPALRELRRGEGAVPASDSDADIIEFTKQRTQTIFHPVGTCAMGAVHQLEEMGLAGELATYHRYRGLRTNAYGRTIAMDWPAHPVLPSHGYVITPADLDGLVAARAEKAGAVIWQGAEAMAPLAAAGSPTGSDPVPVPPGSPLTGRGRPRERQGPLDLDRGQGPVRDRGGRVIVAVRSLPGQAATGTGPRAWHFAATTAPHATPRSTSTRSSTSATLPARSCPATAGSSRSGTAG